MKISSLRFCFVVESTSLVAFHSTIATLPTLFSIVFLNLSLKKLSNFMNYKLKSKNDKTNIYLFFIF